MIELVDIADLDVVYLSYDEPNKEEFWIKIRNMIPYAKRVDGVHGSDAAHKAAAAVSETERFVLIDGDNLPDAKFFDLTLELTETNRNHQFRWRARNAINNLHYGNGGLSSWTCSFINNMRTHENSTGSSDTNIEFCFDPNYIAMHDCYSVTYPNATPKQAFRAGFREGVKLCTRSGELPSRQNFSEFVWKRNLQNLLVWQTVGRDVENGFWAILGARLGTHYLMLRDWDHVAVRDFDELDKLWELHYNDDEIVASEIARELNQALELDIVELNSDQSKFFKNYLSSQWHNRGIMITEMEHIREIEGW
jgi:hypothetical protein